MSRTFRHESVAVAAAWFVAFAGPTLGLKLLYLRILSAGDLSLFQSGGETSVTWLLVRYMWPADVLTAAALATLVLLVRAAFGARAAHLTGTTVLGLCVAIGVVVVASLRQTGALPSADTLRIAINWLMQNPHLVPALGSARDIILLVGALMWLLTPPVLARFFGRTMKVPYAGAVPSLVLLLWVLLSIPAQARSQTPTAHARQPIWLSVGRSLLPLSQSVESAADSDRAQHEAYLTMAYPNGWSAESSPVVDRPTAQSRLRHVVLISLETAPRKFYDLERSDLPTLRALTAHALVADRHYSPAPMTSMSIVSTLTGRYPPASAGDALRLLGRRRAIGAGALPAMLKRQRFETTFIDTYDLTWNGYAEADILAALGFDTVHDARTQPDPASSDAFERRFESERRSFERAADAVVAAHERHTRAFVVLATHLGHYDWPTPAGTSRNPRDPLGHVLAGLDALVGGLMTTLDRAGLGDEVVLVVTGDHGLRFRSEFAGVNERFTSIDAMFHVPVLLWAPALFPKTVHLPYATSHVDLAPTLLDLLAVPRVGVLFHGDSMLDRRLADRLTFFSSGSYPGLRPLNGFHYRDALYLHYDVVDRVTITADTDGLERPVHQSVGELTEDDVRKRLQDFRSLTR